jgi:hypothetical protein
MNEASQLLLSSAIGASLSGSGPVVQCVLLQHMRRDGKDTKPHPTHPTIATQHHHTNKARLVLTELVQQVTIDTTPGRRQIEATLGGPFTFVGQFPTEGTIVMARRECPTEEQLYELSVRELRDLCRDWHVDNVTIANMLEKADLVAALQEAAPEFPVNPHQLQPPLDGIVVRGDLLLLKVAETEMDDDDDDAAEENGDEDEDASDAKKNGMKHLSNEEFFLDYTKDEYIAFASRTDVVAPSEGEDEDSEEDEDYEENEEDVHVAEGDEDNGDEEEDLGAILNLILAEVIKGFREENGRGPDTRELLELRSQVADKLGVAVPTFEQVSMISDEDAPYKRAAEDGHSSPASPKKVKFTSSALTEDDNDRGARKMPAQKGQNDNGDQEPKES